MRWSHVQNISTSVMVSTVREFLIMGKHSRRFWPARGNNAKKTCLANTLLLYIYSSPLFSFSTLHLFVTHIFFPFTNQQFSLFYCDTEKSSNKIVPPMPRWGGCRQMLENIYFECDPRGILCRTCRTCLVSYSNNSIPLPNITIHHFNNIYNRRDKILERVIEELEVLMHW